MGESEFDGIAMPSRLLHSNWNFGVSVETELFFAVDIPWGSLEVLQAKSVTALQDNVLKVLTVLCL